ncbi:hypothetical protein N2152v2_007024 [Parachlorella kessleri]
MAKILGNYGAAREGAYFKVEQEAELQNYRKKLVKEGKLEDEVPAAAEKQEQTFDESVHVYEVLPEVLAAEARVDAPDAARRKEYERRIKGEPAPLTPAELRKYRSNLHMVGASVGHVPRMSFGRARYDLEGLGLREGELVPGARTLSPQAQEVAARTYVAGVRALVYGSLLGALGLAAATTYVIHSLDIHSGDDFRERVQAGFAPLSGAIKGWVHPLKDRAQAWLGGASQAAAASGSGPSELQRRLASRYNPGRLQAEAGSEASGGPPGL